jgi:D-serine deaminase-like pyridoxal phosphate-dependent protein
LPEVAAQVAQLPRLRLRGLMAIPAPSDEMKQQRAAFAAVRGLYEQLRAGGLAMDTLSMGMSADLGGGGRRGHHRAGRQRHLRGAALRVTVARRGRNMNFEPNGNSLKQRHKERK